MKTKSILRFLLAASALFSTANTPSANTYSRTPNWEGIPARNVTGKLSKCKTPDYWRPETHAKKVCQIDGDEYFMKGATDDSAIEAFGREFAISVIGVKAPKTEFMYEKNGIVYGNYGFRLSTDYFIASKKIDNYKGGYDLRSPLVSYFVDQQRYINKFRYDVAKKIGEHGISQLAVAMTFFNDLHLNNWGYDSDGLVLIDLDTMPRTVAEFFDTAIYNTRFYLTWVSGISLSVNNVKDMITIYESMLDKPIPVINEKVELSPEIIKIVIRAYIEACRYTLQRISDEKPIRIRYGVPSIDVNRLLIDGFREVSLKYDKSYSRQIKKYIY